LRLKYRRKEKMDDTMSDLDDFGKLLLLVLAIAQDLSIEVRIAIPAGPRLTRGRIIPDISIE
jgi:hypothetical protein